MFLVYLNNYNIRQYKAQYLCVLYEALGKNFDAHFVFPKEYLDDYEKEHRGEALNVKNRYGDYKKFLKKLTLDKYTLIRKPEEMIQDAKELYYFPEPESPSKILKISVDCNINEEKKVINEVLKEHNIEAAITWVNNKTLSNTLSANSIPVIHQEFGAFRPPIYISTMYFDYNGVNGNTEFDTRFKNFLKISDKVPILNRKELIKILSPKHYRELWSVLENKSYKYEAGVAMQLEVDTNVLLFNKGNSWIDPILRAKAETNGQILVRPHPESNFTIKNNKRLVGDIIMPSNRAFNFINKCKRVYCLNSSVGLEAVLLGRESVILGDNPFSSIPKMDEETKLKALNFAVFGYLIKSDLLFDSSYYRFRLRNKYNEELIYKKNFLHIMETESKNVSKK
jgi:hypothetical protein